MQRRSATWTEFSRHHPRKNSTSGCIGPLLIEYAEPGQNINANRYCATLQRLRTAIKNKRRGLLTRGVILLHDNARPHTANVSVATLQKFKWEILEHSPYSPDLAPCDFHAFGPLKTHLKGRRFNSDDEVKEAVTEFLRQQPKEFYKQGITRLVSQWDKCLNAHGEFF